MKTIQVYFIYVYDSLKGWVKCSRHVNPENGYEFEETAITHLLPLSEQYPKKEFSVIPVFKTL